MLSGKAFNSPNEAVSDSLTKNFSAEQTTVGQKSPAIFQRIAAADPTAVRECLDAHGNLVWALAKKFTASTAEAETATQEIFLDLWKCADRFDSSKQNEIDFVVLIARRWLLKRMMQSVSAAAEKSTSV